MGEGGGVPRSVAFLSSASGFQMNDPGGRGRVGGARRLPAGLFCDSVLFPHHGTDLRECAVQYSVCLFRTGE